jgi:hypothetical protein
VALESVGEKSLGEGETGVAPGEPSAEQSRSGSHRRLGLVEIEARSGSTTALDRYRWTTRADRRQRAGPRVNELGNCMLLEKNFNISKSNRALKEFLLGVHEFKEGVLTIEEWAAALDLQMPQVDSATTAVDVLGSLFADRTQKIRGDLEQFARGMKARIDLQAN